MLAALLLSAGGATAAEPPARAAAALPAQDGHGSGDAGGAVQPPPRVLDVAYLPQSRALCGGAAAAMVMRYWGDGSARPESFSHLVDDVAGGIRSDALAAELTGRGWDAHAFRGRRDDLRRHVERGRPPIVLLEVAPETYHYVVVVAVPGDGVLFHDPARAPFRHLGREEFERRWSAAERWTLLALPGADDRVAGGKAPRGDPSPDAPGREAPSAAPPSAGRGAPAGGPQQAADGPCAETVREAVRGASAGREAEADSLLRRAASRCPSSAAPLRELAGLRFRQKRWAEASARAREALARAPADSQAVHLLAASRYMRGDHGAALEAWNRVGRPRLASVRAYGLDRTPWDAVAPRLGVAEGDLLTSSRLALARRRAASVPAFAESRVRYRPRADGRADLQVAAVERPLLFGSPLDAAVAAGSALASGELRLTAAGPAGVGETWSASWRWRENRPAVALEAAFPGAFGADGRWEVRGRWDRQTFAAGPGAGEGETLREDRTGAGLRFSRWATADLRWGAGLGLDRWEGRPTHLRPSASLEVRGADDRVAASAETTVWADVDGGEAFPRGSLEAAWRPVASDGDGWSVEARAGAEAVASEAPLSLWPGAGTGSARRHLLRAHPLLEDGVVTGEGFGRVLAHGRAEARFRLTRVGPVWVGGAGFVDAARPWGAIDASGGLADGGPAAAAGGAPGLLVDAGLGLRLAPGAGAGRLRLDAAVGLADEAGALSAGWEAPWPGW